ncbi:MAG: hypothetical protein KDD35_02475 [Bdellovibrionales bacterium]|nr:hypothetical protein [Bdellovibrionales bacterium]
MKYWMRVLTKQSMLLLGTLFSSIGSQALVISIITLMPSAGYSLFHVGLFIAIGRLTTLTVSLFCSELPNRIKTRLLILWSEIVGIVAAFGILIAWYEGPRGVVCLLMFVMLRSAAMSVQNPSRVRLLKEWNDSNQKGQEKAAVWLNKTTQGSILISALLSLPMVYFESIETVVLLDILTYVANGLLIYFLIPDEPVGQTNSTKSRFSQMARFGLFYSKVPSLARLDLALLIGASGVNTLFVKLAGSQPFVATILQMIFGASVWLTGFIAHSRQVKSLVVSPWWGLAFGMVALALASEVSWWMMIGPVALVFASFWVLFHRYSMEIQTRFSLNEIAGVTGARMVQVNIVVILMEMFVGANSSWISASNELFLRAGFFALIALVVSSRERKASHGEVVQT